MIYVKEPCIALRLAEVKLKQISF